jgi:pro-apoptotic serine protease NMA111
VDLEKGLILTNRHVVTVGPVIATVTFQNKEEVDCVPVYRCVVYVTLEIRQEQPVIAEFLCSDPIHDFGFFRSDPSDVQFASLSQIPLKPEGAKVGTEIRVIGVRPGA